MPSREEEEYFAQQEYQKRRALAEKARAQLNEEQKAKLKAEHWMRCPKCGSELLTIALHGLEVDKCPECSGMWLDVGELERIIERTDRSALRRIIDIFK